MEKYLKLITSQLNDFWKGMDSSTRKKLIIAVSALLIFIIAFSLVITHKDYTVLYSNLDSKEAGEILNKLEEMKVDVKPEGNGTIMVLKDQEAKIRMQLAAEGYPKSGFNYDTTQSSLGLGATDFDKRKADRIQLQDRLQTAIKTMDGVLDAIVTISMPEQDSFVLKQDKQPTTASVLLKLGNNTLSSKQIKGIEELVAKSVLGLKPENISIVDSNMNALNVNNSSESGSMNTNFEMEKEVRDSFQRQVLQLLEPVFAKGNIVVSAYVRLNFDKKTSEVVRFEPVTDDDGIAVSINELKEEVNNGAGGGQNTTGQTQYAAGNADEGNYTRINKTINYEVNQTKEKIENAQGKIEELTISILINNSELDESTIKNVEKLVSKAIGVDSDKIVVTGMEFDGKKSDIEAAEKDEKKARNYSLINQALGASKYLLIALLGFFALFSIIKLISKINIPQKVEEYKIAEKLNNVFNDDFEEMPEESKDQIMQKQRIDNLIDTKPEIAALQIHEWLNEE